MNLKEVDDFHNKFYRKQSEVLKINDLITLLEGNFLAYDINYEYSIDICLSIDDNIANKIIQLLKEGI